MPIKGSMKDGGPRFIPPNPDILFQNVPLAMICRKQERLLGQFKAAAGSLRRRLEGDESSLTSLWIEIFLKNFFPHGLYVRRKKILGGGAVRFIDGSIFDSARVERMHSFPEGILVKA